MGSIISKADVDKVRLYWSAYKWDKDTEVVELIDDTTGERSILIKKSKK